MSLAAPYGSLVDPAGSSVMGAAIDWIEAAVLGSVATSVALIAIAAIGLMMLTGRVPLRRSATVLAGCFVLFGAPVIAAGIQSAARGGGSTASPRVEPAIAASPLSALPTPQAPPPGYDPYAGAAVPVR